MLQRAASDGIELRISEWHKAWLMFLESPLWGIGIGHYGWHSFNYQAMPEFSAVTKADLFHHSHNLIMQVLAELGMTGLLLVALLAFTWLRQALPFWKDPSYWLIFVVLAVLFMHSNLEYPFWYNYFLGIAAILLGLGSKDMLKIRFTPRLGQFTAGIVLTFSAAMLVITYLGFQDLVYARRIAMTTTPQQALATVHAVSKNALLTPLAEAAIVQNGLSNDTIEQQLLLTTRLLQYRPSTLAVSRQIVHLALAGSSLETSALVKKASIVYPSDFPTFACHWRLSPLPEIQALWKEAEKQIDGTIECRTTPLSSANPS
jgi:hypothetical protein